MMRALTLWRPWPALITVDHPRAKRTENRDWSTGYRGRFALHAGKRWDNDAFTLACRLGLEDLISWNPADHPTGVIAVPELVDVCELGVRSAGCRCDEWAARGANHLRLGADAQALEHAVDCSGRQGWWALPADVEAAVCAQLAGAVT